MNNLSKQQLSIFDGIIISDGYLKIGKKSKNASFSLTTSVLEFAQKTFSIFPDFPWATTPIRIMNRYDKRTNKYYKSIFLESRVSDFFTLQRKRWYPDGKKIVPKDIFIDKDFLLWWYIGDGHLHRKKSRHKYRRVILSTDSFCVPDIYFLIDKLRNLLGNNVYLENKKRIVISSQSLCQFIDIIGTVSPIKHYQYKFDFGQYLDKEYFSKSYNGRPLQYINLFRKKNKVRELIFVSCDCIKKKEKKEILK